MTCSPLRRGLLAVAAGAALTGGCGSDEDDAAAARFRQDAKAALAEVSAINRDLDRTIQNAGRQSDRALAAAFSRLADRSREAVGDLEALAPSDGARREVDGLAAALRTGARDLDALAAAVRAGDRPATAAATARLVNDTPAISSAADALRAELDDPGG